ncbi:hypothetical protein [Nostoc sp. UIC 10630]|uniref:hypothetical protein n=1 Tax=Nostoc sp. UIC 10630 TaxID=2100146 RepID=UPI0013D577B8|nr:hypothetical protein [Nostoc sp. UIC 10630]NEU81340.1 hypothetical protein [Nostoc sp. UIC 10630]
MKNRERPKSAVLERMGSSAAFAWQFCAVTKGNFRNIQANSLASQLGSLKGKGKGGKVLNLLPLTPAPYPHFVGASPSPFPSPHPAILGWRTARARVSQLERVLSKGFRGENR